MDGGYGQTSGTSMASPVVAALAAMLREALTRRQARGDPQRISATATDAGPAGRDDGYGAGLINPVAALGPGFVGTPSRTSSRRCPSTPSPRHGCSTPGRPSRSVGRGPARLSRDRPRRAPSGAAGRRDDRIQPHHPGSRDVGSRAGDAGRHRGNDDHCRRSTSPPGRRLPTDGNADLGGRGTSASSAGPTFRSMPWSMSSAALLVHTQPRGAGCSPRRSQLGSSTIGRPASLLLPPRSKQLIDVGRPMAGGPDLVPQGHGGRLQHRRRRGGCERAPARNAGDVASTAVSTINWTSGEPTRSRTVRWCGSRPTARSRCTTARRYRCASWWTSSATTAPAAPGTCGCRRCVYDSRARLPLSGPVAQAANVPRC